MLSLFVAVAVGVAIIAAVAILLVRDGPVLTDDPLQVPPVALSLDPDALAQISRVRFPVVVRGYRMQDVDAVIADLIQALAQRDERISLLSGPEPEESPGLAEVPDIAEAPGVAEAPDIADAPGHAGQAWNGVSGRTEMPDAAEAAPAFDEHAPRQVL